MAALFANIMDRRSGALSPCWRARRDRVCHQAGDCPPVGARDTGGRYHARYRAGRCGLRQSDAAPAKYWLSNLPGDTSLTTLVATAKGRWRIERDYQELKQAFGLKHYEGRNWRGFHHHATLCTVAYGFLVMERLRCGDQKKSAPARQLPYPKATGRGVIKRAQRHVVNSIATLRWELNQAIMIALGSRLRCL